MSLEARLFGASFGDLTSYFSMDYLMFFLPIVILLYSIIGEKSKKYFLILASYVFFWLISGWLTGYLIINTISIYFFGIWLERLHDKEKLSLKEAEKEQRKQIKGEYLKQKRGVLGLAAALHIGILLVLKYSGFFMENVNSILNVCKVPIQFEVPHYFLPIGISFFSLQAVSYLFDVYRGTLKADHNIFRLALFMSFFPKIVEGPIYRYEQTAEQLWSVTKIEHQNLVWGSQRILYGMMKKMVIADRLNPLIQEVFINFLNYDGGVVAIAAVCYTIQLYMEFSGTMDAVIGTAQIFGVKLPENFARPFFSKTISDFWARWHISLGAWFKDYIFYPVTLSKPVKKMTSTLKKKVGNYFALLAASAVALFCVWFCNGLWHGAAWNYIFFGMYHFGLILMGNMVEPMMKKVRKALRINPNKLSFQIFQMLRTSILVVIGELFFRGHGLKSGLIMFKMMLTDFSLDAFRLETIENLGIDRYDVGVVFFTLGIILMISILQERGIKIRESFAKQPLVLRWAVMYGMIFFVIIFGAYGLGYIPVDPIYANF